MYIAPLPKAAKIAETNWQTPIDEVDGASRVVRKIKKKKKKKKKFLISI